MLSMRGELLMDEECPASGKHHMYSPKNGHFECECGRELDFNDESRRWTVRGQ